MSSSSASRRPRSPNKIGRRDEKVYFAIAHDQLRLVRLENDKGAAAPAEYVYAGWETGFAPDAKNVDQFADLLGSRDKADVLSALVFLGGRHLAGRDRAGAPEPHESKYASLFQEAMGDPRIHALIERLTVSGNDWIAQAAKLAARGPRERLLE